MRVVLLAMLGSCLVQPVQAAESWLQRLTQAEHQSFQGTFIYERNGSFSTHAVWHKGGDETISERLLQLDGPAQEVLRVDGRPQCMTDALAGQAVEAQWPARELNAARLQQHYDLRVLGSSRVAGRSATVLARNMMLSITSSRWCASLPGSCGGRSRNRAWCWRWR